MEKIFAYAFVCLNEEIEVNVDGLDNPTRHFIEGVMAAAMDGEIDAEVAVDELMYLSRLLEEK